MGNDTADQHVKASPQVQRERTDVGANGDWNETALDVLEAVARDKHVSAESLRTYGARIERGTTVAPMYGPDLEPCSTYKMRPGQKGLNAKGKRAGVFLPSDNGAPRRPKRGETWMLVEDVAVAAALYELGHFACGMPGKQLGALFAPLFNGVDVILFPNQGEAGKNGNNKTASRLRGHAASVRIARLPGERSETNGFQVRDPLSKPEHMQSVSNAIKSAQPWPPPSSKITHGDTPTIMTADGRTETSNARRLVEKFGNDLRWCDAWEKWLVWDGRRWAIDGERRLDANAKEIASELWQACVDAAPTSDKDTIRNMLAFARASNSANGVRNMIALARSEKGIPISPSELDQDPWLLNVANGTVDLRSSDQSPYRLRPHDRNDFVTKLCAVNFDATATYPTWLAFLDRIMAGDQDLVDYIQRLVGYCLTGCTTEHILPFLYGTGANGKSTLLGVLLDLLGEDYAIKAPADLLLAKKGAHPTELTDLYGRRFVACIEAEDGRRMAESLVKELTGGDKIRARRMREDFWEFHATHKVWLSANHKPIIRGQDYGMWRRVKLIPFNVSIPDDRQDKELPAKLRGELPGILNWALAGCDQWQHQGLGEPDEVKSATSGYKAEMDIMGRFIDECCVVDDACQAGATDLYDAYKKWGGTESQTRFGDELAKREFAADRFTSGPKKGRKMRRGIGLLHPDAAEE
jgi:putative DNA primase/helicase